MRLWKRGLWGCLWVYKGRIVFKKKNGYVDCKNIHIHRWWTVQTLQRQHTRGAISNRQRSGRASSDRDAKPAVAPLMPRSQCAATRLRLARFVLACGAAAGSGFAHAMFGNGCTTMVHAKGRKSIVIHHVCVCRLQMKHFHYALLIKGLFYEMCVQCMILVYWCKKFPYFMHVDGKI
jgi:hypothetical protein